MVKEVIIPSCINQQKENVMTTQTDNNMSIPNTEDLYDETKAFLTKKQFETYVYELQCHDGHTTFIEATNNFVLQLEKVVEENTDYDSLRKELLSICADRKEFIQFATSYEL